MKRIIREGDSIIRMGRARTDERAVMIACPPVPGKFCILQMHLQYDIWAIWDVGLENKLNSPFLQPIDAFQFSPDQLQCCGEAQPITI